MAFARCLGKESNSGFAAIRAARIRRGMAELAIALSSR
jgi:hypothetical protein